jgi:hypothetical protein
VENWVVLGTWMSRANTGGKRVLWLLRASKKQMLNIIDLQPMLLQMDNYTTWQVMLRLWRRPRVQIYRHWAIWDNNHVNLCTLTFFSNKDNFIKGRMEYFSIIGQDVHRYLRKYCLLLGLVRINTRIFNSMTKTKTNVCKLYWKFFRAKSRWVSSRQGLKIYLSL